MEFDEKCYIIAHVTAVVVMGFSSPHSCSKERKNPNSKFWGWMVA